LPTTLGEQLPEESLSVVVAGGVPATTDPVIQLMRGLTVGGTMRQLWMKTASYGIQDPQNYGASDASGKMPNPNTHASKNVGRVSSSNIGDVGANLRVTYIKAAGQELVEDLVFTDVSGTAMVQTGSNAVYIQRIECTGPTYPTGTLTIATYDGNTSTYKTLWYRPASGPGGDDGYINHPMFQVVPAGKVGFARIDSLTRWNVWGGYHYYGLICQEGWMAGADRYQTVWGSYYNNDTAGAELNPAPVPDRWFGPFKAGDAIAVKRVMGGATGDSAIGMSVAFYDA
jgi:hypothetical protein